MKLTIENLKCCGNCNHRDGMDVGENYEEWCTQKNTKSSWRICKNWKYDEMTISHRSLSILEEK